MPKCNNCQYLQNDSYEYPEYYCKIFGYDVPTKYQTKNDDGCKCTQKHLKKLSDIADKNMEEYWNNYTDDVGEFFGYLDDVKMLIKVIKNKTPILDPKYLKEYHHKLINKKCELKLPTQDLYAILNYSIAFILEVYTENMEIDNPIMWNKEQINWYKLLGLKENEE